MYAKTVWNKEIHVLNLKQINTLDQLSTLIRNVFKNIPTKFILKVDNGHDLIQLTNQQTFSSMKQQNIHKIKLVVSQLAAQSQSQPIQNQHQMNSQENKQMNKQLEIGGSAIQIADGQKNEKIIHLKQQRNIIEEKLGKQIIKKCHFCETELTDGVAYRCSVCSDFNLCQDCESNYDHKHPFVKLKNQNQRKYKIFAVVQEELPQVKQDEQQHLNAEEPKIQNQPESDNPQHKQQLQHKDQKIQTFRIISDSAHWIYNKLGQFRRYYMGQFCNPENVVEDEDPPKQNNSNKELIDLNIQNNQSRQSKKVEHDWNQIEGSDEQNEEKKN